MSYNRQLVAERLKYLRKQNNKKIPLIKLSEEIEEKTEVYISATQLNKYENPEKSDIMNVENLIAIADYYDVPYEYLLGKSESKKRENINIHERTGLSDESVSILEEIWRKKETFYIRTRAIDELIKNKGLIEMVSDYLFTQMVESEAFLLMYTEKDYDGTYTDVVKQYEFNDEKHKGIILFEIQAYLKEMREKIKER